MTDDERRIVEWLRDDGAHPDDAMKRWFEKLAADAIERGDHRK